MKHLFPLIAVLLMAAGLQAETTVLSLSSAEITTGKSGSVALGTTQYGSQSVSDPSTWYTFSKDAHQFTACRVCLAAGSNGNGIQMQGNSDDTAKQAFMANTSTLKKISQIQLVVRVASSNPNAPACNVYVGESSLPTTNGAIADTVMRTEEGFRCYTLTYLYPTQGNYFALRNDQAGAIYLDTIRITYEGSNISIPGDTITTPIDTTIISPEEGVVVDKLDQALTGVIGSAYTAFADKKATSDAVYAGLCAGANGAIQLRSNSEDSGVITTTGGGLLRRVQVVWEQSTLSDRVLDIYGSSVPYTDAAQLYDNQHCGTLLGSITCGESTVFETQAEYPYMGFRSRSGALYLTAVYVFWQTENGDNNQQDIHSTSCQGEVTKLLRGGQLILIRDGVEYTIMGTAL